MNKYFPSPSIVVWQVDKGAAKHRRSFAASECFDLLDFELTQLQLSHKNLESFLDIGRVICSLLS